MKLSVRELKAFKQKSAFIKKNNILPILDYLKFENGTVTKSALHEFITQDIKCTESFLVDERELMGFVDSCDGEEIDLKFEDKRVIISYKKTKTISPTDDVSLFPAHEVEQNDPFVFDAAHISALQIASEFIQPKDHISIKEFIHVGAGAIMASDGFVAFLQKFNDPLPNIVFRKSEISPLARFREVSFTQNEKYHFFSADGCKYGFLKSDSPFFDISKFLTFSNDLPKTIIDKHELIRFNDLCISRSLSDFTTVTMSPNKRNIDLNMLESEYERSLSTQILAENKDQFTPFAYVTKNMNRLLKSLPDDSLIFYRGENSYFITGLDTDFVALIMEYRPIVIDQPKN